MPVFKYQQQHARLKNCPPTKLKSMQLEGYRLVKNDPPAASDFIPCALMQPARCFSNTDQECSAWGLSLFSSSGDLEAKFERLRKNMKNFSRVFGDKVAKGT